jgi:hypothetical protein
VKGVKNILSSKGKMSDDKEDHDAKRQEEALRKQREYQRAYEAKNKEEINRKKRERYAKERKVITKAILKDAVARGLSDAEIAKLVREM